MASLQDLRRRIRSVRNTRKITRAMELVAGARLRRAQQRIETMRPYAERMQELMVGTARAASSVRGLPLLRRHDEERRVAIVVLTGDRGLAGAFNAQVLRRAFAIDRALRGEGKDVKWFASGRKGASTLRFRRYPLEQAWVGFSDRPEFLDAQAVAHRVAESYSNGDVDRVVVVYNEFVSPILQRVLPAYVETQLYRALLESAASEQGARMTSMRNATKSAGELIDQYTLRMNRARQAEITQEILEVVAGADA